MVIKIKAGLVFIRQRKMLALRINNADLEEMKQSPNRLEPYLGSVLN